MARGRNDELFTILLVEDNAADVRLVRDAFRLGSIYHPLYVVSEGIEALDVLYQRGEHEDVPRHGLILLDLNLPKIEGHEVLHTINEDAEHRRISVIILTGSHAHDDILKCYDRYAKAYLAKPVTCSEFIKTVRSFEWFWLRSAQIPLDSE